MHGEGGVRSIIYSGESVKDEHWLCHALQTAGI
jgi:hypothetical protein